MNGPATTTQSMALEGPLAGWFERAGVRHDPHHLVADLQAPSVVPGGGNPIGDTEASGIEAQLRARLSSYKVPRRYVAITRDEVPMLPSNKVSKRDIVSLIAQGSRLTPESPEIPIGSSQE